MEFLDLSMFTEEERLEIESVFKTEEKTINTRQVAINNCGDITKAVMAAIILAIIPPKYGIKFPTPAKVPSIKASGCISIIFSILGFMPSPASTILPLRHPS